MTDFFIAHPLLVSLLLMAIFPVALTALLAWFSAKNTQADASHNDIVEQINNILPQTQCGHCGYPGCKPYAEAIAKGEDINRCPPGGQKGVDRLAELLGQKSKPLDIPERPPSYAFIREDECIGCTKCIQACPVDAILGASKLMHTVIRSECTGCDLCVEPCPVDCIEMRPLEITLDNWQWNTSAVMQKTMIAGNIIASDRTTTGHAP